MKGITRPLRADLLLLVGLAILNVARTQEASLFEIGQRMEDPNFPGLLSNCKYNTALGESCQASQTTSGSICTLECTQLFNSYTFECQNALGLSWLNEDMCVKGDLNLATPIIVPTSMLPSENTLTDQNLTVTWPMLLNNMMDALYYNTTCDPFPTTNGLLMQRCRTEIITATECPQACKNSVKNLPRECFISVAEAATANMTTSFADIVVNGQKNPCPDLLNSAALPSILSFKVTAATIAAVLLGAL